MAAHLALAALIVTLWAVLGGLFILAWTLVEWAIRELFKERGSKRG